jgi:DNA-binding response OmpR family regulator
MSTILILEDEPFIALDLEETLVESGHQDHVTLSTCKDASAWLDAHTPAAAIIDPRLSDGICTTVVRRLSDLGVPFVVYSGEPDSLIENERSLARAKFSENRRRPTRSVRPLAERSKRNSLLHRSIDRDV